MVGKLLLDTNAIMALFARDNALAERLIQAEEVFVSTITLGELYYGAQNSSQVSVNLERIEQFVDTSALLECNTETARYYGHIKAGLRAKGRPIPENDIWIAAVALQHKLTVLSKDERFTEVDKVELETW